MSHRDRREADADPVELAGGQGELNPELRGHVGI